VLNTIAVSWNSGQGRRAAECFAEHAIYLEPPDRQLYRGRATIAAFFESSVAVPLPDRMTWHHAAFNQQTQVGFAEYTYRGQRYYHGIVVITFRDGLIETWREYQYGSTLPWTQSITPKP
jgi:SnoaL-like domain